MGLAEKLNASRSHGIMHQEIQNKKRALGLSLALIGLDDCAAAARISQRMLFWMDFGWEKKLQAQPRIGLAWQRVAGLFLLGVLEGTSSGAEACHSSRIVSF